MREIVVDTTVIIAVVTNEVSKAQIIDATLDAILVAPRSLEVEVGKAFSRMFKRQRIDLDDAERALKAYSKIPVLGIEIDPRISSAAFTRPERVCVRRLRNRLRTET